MLTNKLDVKELDDVLLKDGREGTVIIAYNKEFTVEFFHYDKRGKAHQKEVEVTLDDIEKVTYRP